MEEAHFSHLYPGSRSSGYDPKFMAIGECWNVDRPFTFRLSSLFTSMDRHSVLITAAAALIRLSLSRSILPSLVNKTPKYLRQELPSNLKRTSHTFPVENHGLGLGGADLHRSHTCLLTAPSHASRT
ncbi:hypothetical protein AMECASPLE_001869 [Ameca splendens]|uniref:Uncharacterized protein n=1 Tax=Ameca splendens TaxID=208324 RepID=A0ABV0Z985_9TELE